MYDVELRRVERVLKRRYYTGQLKNKEVYLFGSSDNSRQIIQILRELGVEPKNAIDNDTTKQGSYCSRLKVISYDEIHNPTDKNKLYIIYSPYWREMNLQLEDNGIPKGNIWRVSRKVGLVLLVLYRAFLGKMHRNKLIKKYGDVPIFLCPYTGTGDVYLIGTFWDEYIKRNGITDYVFVVITGACKKVAMLFDIKNIEVVKKKKYASDMIEYYLYNHKNGKINILNDCWGQVHTNQVEWFRGYKGLYFTHLFRKFVFGLPDDVKPKHPQIKDDKGRVEKLFRQNDLIKGKTVVLSPYSNTLSDLPDVFWEQLVEKIQNKGYMVVTNSSGKTEPAIKGTKGIFFPLDIAPHFIEKAGAFIGVRSGFCDIISGTNAKKIILYDKGNRFFRGSAFEYFNLKEMGLCDDAVEIEYDIENISRLIDIIVKEFTDEKELRNE